MQASDQVLEKLHLGEIQLIENDKEKVVVSAGKWV